MSHVSSGRMTRATAGVVLAAALASAAAGQAAAAPAPGTAPPAENGTAPQAAPGTAPANPSPAPEAAPGTAPANPAPAPAPVPQAPPRALGPSIIPAPTYDAPVFYENQPDYVAPTYSTNYNPLPPVLTAPRPTKPVNPVLPRPGTIKLGSFRAPQPAWLSDADARNLNGQAATIEARTATFYESIGFPKDQAARTAASTTLGALIGGGVGSLAVGVPAAVAGAVIGLPAGAAIGAATGGIVGAVGGAPFGPGSAILANILAGQGALIGLAAGPVVGGLAGAAGGGAIGGGIGASLGGAIGYSIGAGDPGAKPGAPIGGATTEDPSKSKPAPPHPEANQYELHLDQGAKVDYVVAKNGDVSGSVKLGAADIPIRVSAAQADAPFKALGPVAQTARNTVEQAVANVSAQAEKAIPGLKITYPQTIAPKK